MTVHGFMLHWIRGRRDERATKTDLLESLGADGGDAAAVSDDVVTVTIGANDFAPLLDTYLDGGQNEDRHTPMSTPNSTGFAATSPQFCSGSPS
ncbi:hypothetical protein [Antrihabitans stalactiti]|uniref:Uncharacterized protein n=1 Tax=Antrihabitans stalactiti TaxID=2584121 RepID=A0A848KIW4_9NOCA|nr:hypothetical protein [Antrihabitans stalactiti]NMN98645.1 hypothetical protein [Antrihabitans stalactiti]